MTYITIKTKETKTNMEISKEDMYNIHKLQDKVYNSRLAKKLNFIIG